MDPAFTWDQPAKQVRRQQQQSAEPPRRQVTRSAGEGRISLREAEHRFGVTAATLRTWAKKKSIDAVLTDAGSGRQWMVTPESIAHHLSRSPRPAPAKAKKAPAKAKKARPSTGPTPDGSAMLVPRDAWDRLMDQLGNLHDAGLMLAEARERAAKAETEAVFLRERLGELRTERDELKLRGATTPSVSNGSSEARGLRRFFGRRK